MQGQAATEVLSTRWVKLECEASVELVDGIPVCVRFRRELETPLWASECRLEVHALTGRLIRFAGRREFASGLVEVLVSVRGRAPGESRGDA